MSMLSFVGRNNDADFSSITEADALRCSLFTRVILKNFAKFTGKHLCWSLLFNKVARPKPPALSKNRIQHRYFPVKFVKTFKKTYFYITPLVAASDLRNF